MKVQTKVLKQPRSRRAMEEPSGSISDRSYSGNAATRIPIHRGYPYDGQTPQSSRLHRLEDGPTTH